MTAPDWTELTARRPFLTPRACRRALAASSTSQWTVAACQAPETGAILE